MIEECTGDPADHLDLARKQKIVEQLARLGVPNAEERVVVANAFPEGVTAIEASSATPPASSPTSATTTPAAAEGPIDRESGEVLYSAVH